MENESEIIEGIRTKHGDQIPGISIAKIRQQFDAISEGDVSLLIESELTGNLESVAGILDTDDVDSNTRAALISRLVELPNVELYGK
jgi:hypothetical protein